MICTLFILFLPVSCPSDFILYYLSTDQGIGSWCLYKRILSKSRSPIKLFVLRVTRDFGPKLYFLFANMRSSIQYNYAITTLLLCFNPQAFLHLTIEALFVSMKVPQYPQMSRLFAIQLVECMLFRSHHPSCGRNANPLPDWLARVLDREVICCEASFVMNSNRASCPQSFQSCWR